MEKVILKAQDIEGYLTPADKENLSSITALYKEALAIFPQFDSGERNGEDKLIEVFNKMGNMMQHICQKTPQLHVYSFISGQENRPEASRIIAKVRDVQTENHEFVYYIQRAYELLFKLAWGGAQGSNKNYLIVKTPVTKPVQNYAVHKIINIDEKIENTVMCVMLRGALLPSMIISKEIEGYSSHDYITPFALFSIKRNESKKENDMEYILDIDRSFFSAHSLDGKDLVFADPMNATGGSLITIVKHLLSFGIKPRSINFFNVICTLKGALNVVRALDNCNIYTLWMDPALNEDAYIMPGLGDAGDRLIGKDSKDYKRNIIELIANYGNGIAMLYRTQLREIEKTILAGKK